MKWLHHTPNNDVFVCFFKLIFQWIESQHISQIALIWYRLIKLSWKQVAYDSYKSSTQPRTHLRSDILHQSNVCESTNGTFENLKVHITKAKMQAHILLSGMVEKQFREKWIMYASACIPPRPTKLLNIVLVNRMYDIFMHAVYWSNLNGSAAQIRNRFSIEVDVGWPSLIGSYFSLLR